MLVRIWNKVYSRLIHVRVHFLCLSTFLFLLSRRSPFLFSMFRGWGGWISFLHSPYALRGCNTCVKWNKEACIRL